MKEKKETVWHVKIKPGETRVAKDGSEITNTGSVNARLTIKKPMAVGQTIKEGTSYESAE
ncbi:MAG TPA: hypothetical protein V6C65_26230 [Allocoleopsis sp.]